MNVQRNLLVLLIVLFSPVILFLIILTTVLFFIYRLFVYFKVIIEELKEKIRPTNKKEDRINILSREDKNDAINI